jgi:hypothetical protein
MVAAGGAFLMLMGPLVYTAISLARPGPELQPLFETIGLFAFAMNALGYLGLLAGLLVGLPSLDEAESEA